MSTELRDRFFALSAGGAPAEEAGRYRALVDATDAEPAATVDGLAVCWHPTARFKAVRFVDAERIDASVRELFARPSEAAPYLAAVFADPGELSFRTFENILPLDHLFEGVPLELELAGREDLAEDAFSFSLRGSGPARACLAGLDSLGLYVPPLNAASRGGTRFIFHSALLSDALTAAVAAALPPSLRSGFSHVNPVFRANRFEPGEARFTRHRDTPYYDAARQHISRYTLLLYLTGGTGQPALDLAGGPALADIEPFTCVIFDQRYEHEGAPYRDGRKVFLRTELIYADHALTHDPRIGEVFSKACYLTGESVFAPELARHADAYYNQAAAAHWNGLTPDAAGEPYVHKQYRGVHFIANGYDFWFAKGGGLTLAQCAAITLLDYFNCKTGDTAFRAQCQTQVIEASDTAWIPAYLAARPSQPAMPPFDKAALFPDPEQPSRSKAPACGDCGALDDAFDTTRCGDVIKLYTQAQESAKAQIMPAPVLMLGQDVVLDPDKFVIQGNLIHVLSRQSLAPVNFASCDVIHPTGPFYDPEKSIDVASTVGVADFLVPPIIFTESGACYHLRFDFFRNTWMARDHEQSAVTVPMIRPLSKNDLVEHYEPYFVWHWDPNAREMREKAVSAESLEAAVEEVIETVREAADLFREANVQDYLPAVCLTYDTIPGPYELEEDMIEGLIVCIAPTGWAIVHVSDEDEPTVTRGTSEPDGTYLDFLLFDDDDDDVIPIKISLSGACLIQQDLAVEAISLWMESADLPNADLPNVAGFSPPGPLARGIPGAGLGDGNEKEHKDDGDEG